MSSADISVFIWGMSDITGRMPSLFNSRFPANRKTQVSGSSDSPLKNYKKI